MTGRYDGERTYRDQPWCWPVATWWSCEPQRVFRRVLVMLKAINGNIQARGQSSEARTVGLYLWPVACGLWPVACGLWPVACGLWPGLWPALSVVRPLLACIQALPVRGFDADA